MKKAICKNCGKEFDVSEEFSIFFIDDGILPETCSDICGKRIREAEKRKEDPEYKPEKKNHLFVV